MARPWRKIPTWLFISLVLVTGIGIGLVAVPHGAQSQGGALVAKKVTEAPALDGSLDAGWKSAAALSIPLTGGRNLPGGKTEVAMRALYTADTVYFMLRYADATDSWRRSPWVRQADGSWKMLSDPDDKGGDNNLYYEDKLAILWNISSPSFAEKGCFAACHLKEGKPYGNKYTAAPGERLDMWHLKGVRTGTVGQVDDQYVDDTRYDADKAKEAGRKSDPKKTGGYVDNVSDDKKGPKWALKGNKPSPPYWILDAEKEPFDDAKYKAGDEVPSILVAPFTGDRGDIAAKVVWKDGVRIVVMWRKLTTGSEFDVQFSDLKKAHAFGVAVFDNAQVRHAFHRSVYLLRFD